MKLPLFIVSLLLAVTAQAAEPFCWRQAGTELTLTVAPQYTVDASSIRFLPETAKALSSPVPEQGVFGAGTHLWRFDTPIAAVAYQGCGNGICFPPARVDLVAPENETPKFGDAAKFVVVRQASGMMDKTEFLAFLRGKNAAESTGFWAMALLALLGGIALNLTPCVLPLVPVNLAIIGAEGGGATGFRRGLFYGAGMALAYGILGLLAALAGVGFGALNGKWWFNLLVSLLFFLLAAASAGWFQFDALSRFAPDVHQLKGGRSVVAFFLGAFAALLAGACVAPVAAGVLLFTAETFQRGEFYALLLPFLLGIGMALPWPLAGAGLIALPKPGRWMFAVKYALALIVAAMGVYYAYLGVSLLRYRAASPENEPFSALDIAAQKSLRDHRPILVDFTTSWCKNCAAMKRTTLADGAVQKAMTEDFHVVTFPAEDPSEPRIAALLKAWRVPGFPAFVIVHSR